MKVVLWLWLWCVAACGAEKERPNIVFILTDDQGFADVSWHNPEVHSPNLQQLVDGGVKLNYNYVQPICTPTRSALMTGFYPYHLGRQNSVLFGTTPTGLTIEKELLPQQLQKLGYKTHIVGKWHLGFCDWQYTPTFRGFDSFFGFYQGKEDYYTHDGQGGYDFRENQSVHLDANGTYSTYLFGDRAVQIIEEAAAAATPAPFFLYLPLQSIHRPIQVPDEYLHYYPEGPDREYLAMVTAMDDVVGRVVHALRDTAQEDNTVIIYSSDNGAMFPERNAPLRGKKWTLWEGGVRVPGLIYSPKLLQNTPREYNSMIHVTDWHNTILSMAGQETMPENDGYDQWQSLSSGHSQGSRDSLIYNLDSDGNVTYGAIRVGRYKLALKAVNGKDWLIDLDADPYETTNLIEARPDVASELEALLLAQLDTMVPHDTPEADDAGEAENWNGFWTPGWCTAH